MGRLCSSTEVPKQKGQPERAALPTSSGAGEKTRTSDLRITNALLYQLSYTGETLTCETCSTSNPLRLALLLRLRRIG